MARDTIWKFPIEIAPEQSLPIQGTPRLLFAGLCPRDGLCIWAEVDSQKEDTGTLVSVFVVGTGQSLPLNARYLSSVISLPFVWHVYVGEHVEVAHKGSAT
jgi:hypothetical protein